MGKQGLTGPEEFKTFPISGLNVDFEGRTIEGYAAIFGNVDLGGDIVHKGAFKKTLQERGDKVAFLWQHDLHEPIGRPQLLREDEKGLFFQAIVSKTARGNDALELMKDGAVGSFSIGYDAIPGGTSFERRDGQQIRHLKEVRLWCFSLVTIPMNPEAALLAIKDITGKASFPLGGRERPWDASEAVERCREWAGVEDEPNAKYKSCFLRWNPDKEGDLTGGELPFVDIVDGEAYAVPEGLFAVADILSEGQKEIPSGELGAVKDCVEAYYAKMREAFSDEGIVAPWKREPSEEKRVDVTENTIRIQVRPDGDFQKGTFKTIRIGKEEDGIQALIGRLKGKTTTAVRTYIFDKDKWTRAKAEAWVKKHKKEFDYMAFVDGICGAFHNQVDRSWEYIVSQVYDDRILVTKYDRTTATRSLFRVPYVADDEGQNVVVAPEADWVPIKLVEQEIAPAEEKQVRLRELSLARIELEQLRLDLMQPAA